MVTAKKIEEEKQMLNREKERTRVGLCLCVAASAKQGATEAK